MPRIEKIPENHLYRAYGVYLLKSKHRLIRRLKKHYEPSVHGDKTWNSSFLLMDYLRDQPLDKKARVLEVGCGWGPGSIFCAKEFKAKVTALDIDKDVFPFLDVMAELNDVKVKPLVKRFEKIDKGQLAKFDVIIGSDICFWDSMVKPLQKLVSRAIDAGVERVIITDPGRPTFYEMCDALTKRHTVDLCEWYAYEPDRFDGEVVEIRA